MIDDRYFIYATYVLGAVTIASAIWAWPELRRIWREQRRTDALLVTVTRESGEELVRDLRLSGPARKTLLRLLGLA